MTVFGIRTVVLSELSPYTVNAGFQWPEAQPDDDLDYYADHTPLLCDVDDSPISAMAAAAPSGPGELQVSCLSMEGSVLCVRLSAGVPGRWYRVRLDVVTASGRTFSNYVGLQINPAFGQNPLPIPPSLGLGFPAMWTCGAPPYNPAQVLPPYTVAATGTTSLTAAVVPELAITLINSGSPGGVLIGVQAATWNGARPVFANRSGGPVKLYPYATDSFESQTAGTSITLQNDQTVTLSVAQSGAIIVS
jgi:hypothetical protein